MNKLVLFYILFLFLSSCGKGEKKAESDCSNQTNMGIITEAYKKSLYMDKLLDINKIYIHTNIAANSSQEKALAWNEILKKAQKAKESNREIIKYLNSNRIYNQCTFNDLLDKARQDAKVFNDAMGNKPLESGNETDKRTLVM